MDSIKMYYIKEEYINYLRKFDSKVPENKHEKRPFVGIVLENFFVPLSSPKEKHKKMKNSKDFLKIENGNFGVLNFNNMIPVPQEQLIPFNIEEEDDKKYKELLRNQSTILNRMKRKLHQTAKTLYKLRTTEYEQLSSNEKRVFVRCCDFPMLEQAAMKYNSSITQSEVAATSESERKP